MIEEMLMNAVECFAFGCRQETIEIRIPSVDARVVSVGLFVVGQEKYVFQ